MNFEKKAIAMHAQGYSYFTIAGALGFTKDKVVEIITASEKVAPKDTVAASFIKVKGEAVEFEKLQNLAKLATEDSDGARLLKVHGYPAKTIAKVLNKDISTIYRWLRESQISIDKAADEATRFRSQCDLLEEQRAECSVVMYKKQNIQREEIAKYLDIPLAQVIAYIDRYEESRGITTSNNAVLVPAKEHSVITADELTSKIEQLHIKKFPMIDISTELNCGMPFIQDTINNLLKKEAKKLWDNGDTSGYCAWYLKVDNYRAQAWYDEFAQDEKEAKQDELAKIDSEVAEITTEITTELELDAILEINHRRDTAVDHFNCHEPMKRHYTQLMKANISFMKKYGLKSIEEAEERIAANNIITLKDQVAALVEESGLSLNDFLNVVDPRA